MSDRGHHGLPLAHLVRESETVDKICKPELRAGDWLAVKTLNSTYTIRVLGNGEYFLAGGWFDAPGHGPSVVRINGCTWGGSSILADVVAACGLRLEFSNRVRTSPIRTIALLPHARLN